MFQLQKRKLQVTIESVVISISRIAKTSRKTHVKCERIVHSYRSQKKNKSTSPEGKANSPKKKEVTVAIVNIANHSPRDYFRKALVIRNFNEQTFTFRILSCSTQQSGLCCVFRAQTFLESVGAVLLLCVLRRQHSRGSHCMSIPHSYAAHI